MSVTKNHMRSWGRKMRLFEEIKKSATAMQDGLRFLAVLGSVIAAALVAISIELMILCVKL